MEIAIASDHNGYPLKEQIRKYLMDERNLPVIDCGTNSEDHLDYPEVAQKLCQTVKDGQIPGIAFDDYGLGMGIACNKTSGILAATVHDEETARKAKEHHDANIICLGADNTDLEDAKRIIDAFLESNYQGGHHSEKVDPLRQA